MPELTLDHIDLDRLRKLADHIVRLFPTELVIGLVGTLGAGKTTLTQALADAAGVDPEEVTSPTFTLLCSYDAAIAAGDVRLHHLDAYRLSDEDEFLELGVEEMFESDRTWVLIEWADRVRSVMPPSTLWMNLDIAEAAGHEAAGHEATGHEPDGQDTPTRVIKLSTEDPNLASRLEALRDAMDA